MGKISKIRFYCDWWNLNKQTQYSGMVVGVHVDPQSIGRLKMCYLRIFLGFWMLDFAVRFLWDYKEIKIPADKLKKQAELKNYPGCNGTGASGGDKRGCDCDECDGKGCKTKDR